VVEWAACIFSWALTLHYVQDRGEKAIELETGLKGYARALSISAQVQVSVRFGIEAVLYHPRYAGVFSPTRAGEKRWYR